MPPEELSHREVVKLVTEYLEAALSPADRARFERHLATCADCAAYLEQMRMTIRLVGTLRTEAISAEAWQQLLATFRNWRQGREDSS
jgi:anti-sigma factor RsiW